MKKRDNNSTLEMLACAKSMGARVATIASAGDVSLYETSLVPRFIPWLEIHHWLNNHLVMPFWALL
ncbi:hypothetical protein RHGRI_034174 [Rhododendron griersonianum]|uniref:Uncharacterized protein n=1 Tax=Rhododendron griersonianum TaxID=479676 RepID=A0AAV6I550_9ERIC|nr:hypothetical protein RHGRI_034174 [Rhododendron griersonianum]